MQTSQEFLLTVVLAKSFALAFLDDIHAVTQIALLEDDVAGLEMLLPNAGFKSDLGLRQLGRKQCMKQPVCGDPDLAIETRHLHQINATPQQPRVNSAELEAENLRHRSAMPKRAECSEPFELEFRASAALHGRRNIDGGGGRLANGMLGGRRDRCTCDRLDRGAVTERPDLPFMILQLQARTDEQFAAFLPAIEFLNGWRQF